MLWRYLESLLEVLYSGEFDSYWRHDAYSQLEVCICHGWIFSAYRDAIGRKTALNICVSELFQVICS